MSETTSLRVAARYARRHHKPVQATLQGSVKRKRPMRTVVFVFMAISVSTVLFITVLDAMLSVVR